MRLLDGTVLYWNNKQDAYSKAECYREGTLVKQSMPRALVLYQKAAQAGDARAVFRLGEYYQQNNQKPRAFKAFYEAGTKGNQDAINFLQNMAKSDPEAALLLGKIYECIRQHSQAIIYYQKAHALNHPDGLYHVAKLFDYVSYSERQGKEVVDFYRDSVVAGSKYGLDELTKLSATSGKAAFYLAQLYENNLKQIGRAVPFYEKASQQRYGEATHVLGHIYAQGRENIAIDVARASRNYLTATQQGYLSALPLLQALANQGHAETQYILGYEHYRVKGDISNAVLWCVKAEMQGYAPAAAYLNTRLTADIVWKIASAYDASEINIERHKQKALEYAIKASDLGFKEASVYLAKTYHQGNQGVIPDRQKSYSYSALAAKQGQDSSRQALEQLAESGDKEAQYHIGYGYYREKNDLERAVTWCVKAEIQGHKKAADYLQTSFTAELYWKIGGLYEKDISNAEISLLKVVEFFKKAAQLHHAQAAFWLAHHYQSLADKSVENETSAFNYFLQSAQNGCEAALPALERLGTNMNRQQQTAMSQLYGSLFYNPERATYWSTRNQATQSKHFQLTK